VMDRNGESHPKTIQKNYERYVTKQQQRTASPNPNQSDEYANFTTQTKNEYANFTTQTTNDPPKIQTKGPTVTEAVDVLLSWLEAKNGPQPNIAPTGQLKDDYDPKYRHHDSYPPAGSTQRGDNEHSTNEPPPRVIEYACMATVSNTDPDNRGSMSNRLRRIMSPFQRVDAAPQHRNPGDNNTAHPNNITVDTEEPAQEPQSGISPMSESNHHTVNNTTEVPGTSPSIPFSSQPRMADHERSPISTQDRNTCLSVLHQLSAMSPGQDLRDIIDGIEQRNARFTGLTVNAEARPTVSQNDQTTTAGAPADSPVVTTEDNDDDSHSESEHESEDSDDDKLSKRTSSRKHSSRKKSTPEEILSKRTAKLTKKLLDTATRTKVKMFRKEDIPLQRRRKFMEFVQSITPVLRTDRKTQTILKNWPKVDTEISLEGKMAFYSLIHAYVDPYYRTYLQRHPDEGCAAFLALSDHCAQNTAEDRANYGR
ncbi:MAG: hypothetical protein ACRDL7_05175, partial [Gaiellaceae bacterium]